MNQAEFNQVVQSTVMSIQKLLAIKGGEYAGSEDRLSNFKRGAVLTGAHPLQVLFIYLSKHYDALATFVRDVSAGTTRELSEPIEGRLDDIINYCLLAKALIKEHRDIAHAEGMLAEVNRRDVSRIVRQPAATEMGLHAGNGRLDDDRVWDSPPHTGTGVPAFRDTGDSERSSRDHGDIYRG